MFKIEAWCNWYTFTEKRLFRGFRDFSAYVMIIDGQIFVK